MSTSNRIGASSALCPATLPVYQWPLAQLVLLIPDTTQSIGRCSYQLYAASHRLAHDWRIQCHSDGVLSYSMVPPPMLRSQRPWMQLLERLWPSCCPLCHGNPLAVTLWHTGDRGAQGRMAKVAKPRLLSLVARLGALYRTPRRRRHVDAILGPGRPEVLP